ncbi:hypothetical protein P8452_27723 [Trifolium repens]|nr:hypothetical protein P8452_27723 [Trifolium repens]
MRKMRSLTQPLSQTLRDAKVPENFMSPHLPTFDGKSDPSEHLMAVGTQTAIIGASYHLKCKLLSGTLKEAALRWYMNLPKHSIESWLDFQRKFIQQPATSMQEIIKRAECYIKDEESNAEKRTRGAREKDPTNRGNRAPYFYPQRRRPLPDHGGQEPHRKPYHQQFRRDVERLPQRNTHL